MPFASLFSNVAARLFAAAPAAGASTPDPELVRLVVEEIVEAVDPRLRGVSRYQKRIAPAAERTIAHLRSLGRDLPAPMEFSRAAWSSEPLLNAAFAAAGDLPALLGRSEELRAFFAAPANAEVTQAHALLAMLKTERRVFAPALVDGALQQEVAQTTVSFEKHRLFAPAANAPDCRRQVGMLILRRLAGLALQRFEALGERATELEQHKALLGARLRMLNLRRDGLGGLDGLAGGGDAAAQIASIERELKATVDDYMEAKASLATLESRIEHIKAIFDSPAQHVSLTRSELRVNRMGFKVAEASSEQAPPLVLSELSIGSGLTAVIALVHCPRAELPPREDLIARAAKELL